MTGYKIIFIIFLAASKTALTLAQTEYKMEAIEFVQKYTQYLVEIEQVIKPELKTVIDELRQIDPHDLIRPETYFSSESEARGYIWSIFVKRAKMLHTT